MNKANLVFLTLIIAFFSINVNAQSILGIWKTIDDKEKGLEKGLIEIYETDKGTIEAKVIKVLDTRKAGEFPKCISCSGSRKDQPIVGMVIMWDLKKDGDEYVDGNIVDPDTGKEWSVEAELESEDVLKVRGYFGFSLFGRNQRWYRNK